MKVNVLEFNHAIVDDNVFRYGQIDHIWLDVEQIEHVLHVDEALLDKTIVRAEEIQRCVQLEDVGAVEYIIADTQLFLRTN